MPNKLLFTATNGEQLWACVNKSGAILSFWSINPSDIISELHKNAKSSNRIESATAIHLLSDIEKLGGINYIEG